MGITIILCWWFGLRLTVGGWREPIGQVRKVPANGAGSGRLSLRIPGERECGQLRNQMIAELEELLAWNTMQERLIERNGK